MWNGQIYQVLSVQKDLHLSRVVKLITLELLKYLRKLFTLKMSISSKVNGRSVHFGG